MPRYEYRCRACGSTFEKTRPLAESSAPIACPDGHDDTVKLISAVAVGGMARATGSVRASGQAGGGPASGGGGGGCCGGGCCS